jgi:hypothetical protein
MSGQEQDRNGEGGDLSFRRCAFTEAKHGLSNTLQPGAEELEIP